MKRPPGFSLPQLLVALVVLAVLLLLSAPAINSARNQALSAQCLQRLQQTGIGLFAFAADHQQSIPTAYNEHEVGTPNRSWATRLVHQHYITNPDVLFCPAFFPRNDQEAQHKPSVYSAQGPQTYGYRLWVEPGRPWTMQELYRGSVRLSAIERPSDFFLVADSLWTAPTWRSQGYQINPGSTGHLVHLRHRGVANALFADGHVEGKPAPYFESLSDIDRQRAYTGNQSRQIYTIEKAPF